MVAAVTEEWFAPGVLALYALWGLVAIGVRAIVQARRTGDSGFRIVVPARGSTEWWVGLMLVGAIVVGLAAPCAALAGLDPLSALGRTPLRMGGLVIATLGIAATLAAQLAMGDSWRIGVDPQERTELVRSGPFRLVRNPIFTAMMITGFGLALAEPNVLALVGFALLVSGLELQVRRVEEPYLTTRHGAAYARYANRVGRFVPGVGRLRPHVSSR